MGGLILDAIVYLLQHFLDGFTTLMTTWMAQLQTIGITEAQSAFVRHVDGVMEGVAVSLLVLYLAYTGVHEYILWGEGAMDTDGSHVWRGALMASLGIAAASAFTIGIFRWGMDLAGTVAGVHVYQSGLTVTRVFVGLITTEFSGIEVLILLLIYAVTVALLLVVVLTTAIRAAELAFYTAAAPLFALGLVKRDHGIFKGFYQKLIILAISQAVVIFAVKAGNAVIANMGHTLTSVATAPLLYLGFLWVALRGPHMLSDMIYHTGVGNNVLIPLGKFGGQTAVNSYAKSQAANAATGEGGTNA